MTERDQQGLERGTPSTDLQALLAEEQNLHETVIFSKEDMKKLRRPNRQPEDSDYFNLNLPDNLDLELDDDLIEVDPLFQAPEEALSQPNEEGITPPSDTEEWEVPSLAEWDETPAQETRAGEETQRLSLPLDLEGADDPEFNPFIYRPKYPHASDLSAGADQKAAKQGFWNRVDALYDARYALDHVENIDEYDQFDAQALNPTKIEQLLAQWWQQLSQRVTRQSTDLEPNPASSSESGTMTPLPEEEDQVTSEPVLIEESAKSESGDLTEEAPGEVADSLEPLLEVASQLNLEAEATSSEEGAVSAVQPEDGSDMLAAQDVPTDQEVVASDITVLQDDSARPEAPDEWTPVNQLDLRDEREAVEAQAEEPVLRESVEAEDEEEDDDNQNPPAPKLNLWQRFVRWIEEGEPKEEAEPSQATNQEDALALHALDHEREEATPNQVEDGEGGDAPLVPEMEETNERPQVDSDLGHDLGATDPELPTAASTKAERIEEISKDDSHGMSADVQQLAFDLTDTRHITPEEIQAYSDQISQATQVFSEPILTDQVLEEYLNEDDVTIEAELNEKQSIVRGATWLTFGNIFSRILGAIYVIPWAAWLGADYLNANTLYSAGYQPYALFLAIGTAGFPSAIAKQMAYYHSKKQYRFADQLFKASMIVMSLMGMITALALFFAAPALAAATPTIDHEAATLVIRSLVPPLVILPVMSLLRGYFQGYNNMVPTAVSQILEQIARVFYMLAATYAVMKLFNGSATTAVVHSTFAAFIGAAVSLIYLDIVYVRQLPMIRGLIESDHSRNEFNLMKTLRIMLMDSIPFILVGSGIIIAQNIDTYTFGQIMTYTSSLLRSEIAELYGVLSLDVNKLIMIIISLAIGISLSSLPAITKRFADQDLKGTGQLVEHVILLFSFVMLPAAVGMASIPTEVYQLFYANGSQSGPALLVTASYMSIILGLYTILSTILQAMNFRRLSIWHLLIGLGVKAILQFPMVALFQAQGTFISTGLGFLVSSILMWRTIHKAVPMDYATLIPKLVKMVVGTALMGVTTTVWAQLLGGWLGPVGRGMTFVKVVLIVLVGVFVYMAVMALFGLLPILFGNRKEDLQKKMRLFE